MRVNAQLIDAGAALPLGRTIRHAARRLLRTQDAIVTHLTRALDFQLTGSRTPASNGRPRQIPTPRTWLSSAPRRVERGMDR